MSLYHQLEALDADGLDDLAEQYAAQFPGLAVQFADLAEARRRTEHAVWDQQYRASADAEAEFEGARADSLTEDLEKALLRLFPGFSLTPTTLRSAA